MSRTAAPNRIVVAGDWHGNTSWALDVIWQAKEHLAGEEHRVILHLGDFGVWPGDDGHEYICDVALALDQAETVLWFVDGNHECVDATTRAVTRRGFISVSDLKATDEVMSVDDDGRRIWLPIDGIIKRHYHGDLFKVSSRGLDMLVTAGHRVIGHPRSRQPTSKWIEHRGDSLSGLTFNVVVAAHNDAPDYDGVSDDELRLLAWCVTDSHQRADGGWHIYQRLSQVSRITDLLARLAIPYTSSVRIRKTTTICGKAVLSSEPEVTVRLGVREGRKLPWVQNSLPDFVWQLSRRQVSVFLDELIFCDGSWATATKGSCVLYCNKPVLRDQLQLLLVSNGYRVSRSQPRPGDWRLNICPKVLLDFDTRYNLNTTVESVQYAGIVWCLRVSNGRFFVERNGKVHLTGNCHDQLRHDLGSELAIPMGPGLYGDTICWLPRGHRWQWHGRRWLALGGAVSVDRAVRVRNNWGWWPEEEITEEQEARVIAGGHADVLVSHDCPSGVVHAFGDRPEEWALSDIARSERHEERLQRIVDATKPAHIMHGHLHRAYQRACDFGYGPVEVTGLDCDGGRGPNWAVLDTKSMTWEVP